MNPSRGIRVLIYNPVQKRIIPFLKMAIENYVHRFSILVDSNVSGNAPIPFALKFWALQKRLIKKRKHARDPISIFHSFRLCVRCISAHLFGDSLMARENANYVILDFPFNFVVPDVKQCRCFWYETKH